MTATLKVQPKGQVTIPLQLWNEAGLTTGGLLKATARRGSIVLSSQAVAPLNDQYSPAQRRLINRKLAKGLEDIRKGRLRGPFDTIEGMIVSMEDEVRTIRAARTAKHHR